MKFIKTIAVLILICTQTTLFSQIVKGNRNIITKERVTSNYNKVTVTGSFDVTLVSGTEGNLILEIESNLEEYLVTEVKNGTLKIKWKKGVRITSKKGVKIIVPFEKIDGVILAGAGNITTKDIIIADKLELKVAGSGDLNLVVKATSIESAIAGSGNIKISGSADTLESRIAGSGDFEGFDLKVTDADFKISGSGTIKASVHENLNARISGSGDVYYKGNPKTDVKISGSGSVSMR